MNKNFLAWTCALFLIVLGGIVLCGWYLHQPKLIQIQAGSVGMVANTALSFLLTGILFIFFLKPFSYQMFFKFCTVCFIIALSLLSISEDIFQYSSGIDHLLITPWLNDPNPTPGGMAPNTSIAFILSSLICILLAYGKTRKIGIIIQLLTLVILLVSLISVLVYSHSAPS